MRKFKKALALVMALTMMTSTAVTLASCGGAREVTAIVAENGTYETTFTEGETVTFDSIVIMAKYNDDSTEKVDLKDAKIYLNDVDITGDLNKITESIGTKKIKIEYAGQTFEYSVVVSSATPSNPGDNTGDNTGGNPDDPVTPPPTDFTMVAGFEQPQNYIKHLAQKNAAGTAAYGTKDYEAQFASNASMYAAGDDNAFKFVPTLRFLNDDDMPETAMTFPSATTVSIKDGSYAELSSRNSATAGVVEYYSGETVYLTANTNNNTYDFTDAAVGRQFKLSVLPSGYYMYSGKPVNCEVNVVDGFNVYNAKQLSIIENHPSEDRIGWWATVKEAAGVTGVNPSAIVLQNEMKLTEADVPSGIKYTLSKDVTYYDEKDTEKTNPISASRTFLYDWETVFYRYMKPGETFKVYGNYFTIDTSKLPLVASFDNEYEENYGTDGSNTQLFRVDGEGYVNLTNVTPDNHFIMENVNVIGNANIDDTVYYDGSNPKYVYAGGLIFLKSDGVNVTIDNIVTRTNFVTFIPEGGNGFINIKNTKAYDSYNQVAYIYARNRVKFENCTFERSGGPLIIAQHRLAVNTGSGDTNDNIPINYPTVEADDNCRFKNIVTGQEFWFNSVGAGSLIAGMKASAATVEGLTQALSSGAVKNSYVNKDGKMNMIALVMCNGTTPATLTASKDVFGKFTYKGYEANRMPNETMGAKVHSKLGSNSAGMGFGISFNMGNGFMWLNAAGNNAEYDMADAAAGYLADFVQADTTDKYITVNMGAISIFMGYYNLNA